MRPALALLLGVLVVGGVAGVVSAHGNHVTVGPQVVDDDELVVESLFVAQDAWVVVHADAGGGPGRPVGHVAVDRGFHDLVRVQMRDGALSDVTGNVTLWVALHGDDGDGTFEPDQDAILRSFGQPAATAVTVRPATDGESGATVAAVNRGRSIPVARSEGRFTVRYAELPAEGYLVVVNDSSGRPGTRVLGATALSGGVHENVSIQVRDSLRDELATEGRATAWIVVYRGTGPFDPTADEPVSVGESPVSSRADLVLVNGSTTNTTDAGPQVKTATRTATGATTQSDTPVPPETSVSTTSAGNETPGFGVWSALLAVLALGVTGLARRRRR